MIPLPGLNPGVRGGFRPLAVVLAGGFALGLLGCLVRLLANLIGPAAYGSPPGTLVLLVGALGLGLADVVLTSVSAALFRLSGPETRPLGRALAGRLLLCVIVVVVLAIRAALLALGIIEVVPPPDWVRFLLGW